MEIYSYVLQTGSGDYVHKILIDKNYNDAIEFIKNEIPWEYESWEIYWEDEWGEYDGSNIDYGYFDKRMIIV
jgi:hypothetical protein